MFVLRFVLHFDSVQFLGWKDSFSLHVDATQINRGCWERVGYELGTSWEQPLLLSYCKAHINRDNNLDSLEQKAYLIVAAAGAAGNYDRTFEHCGYTNDGVYPLPGTAPRYDNP
jgi:hypothetical protein